MVDRARAESLLREYGELTGLGALTFDEDGTCLLEFDDRIMLNIAFDGPREAVLLMTPLGEVRAEERPELVADMLDANALWRGTGGATLGIERATGLAVMALAVPLANLAAGDLERRVDAFVNAAEPWLNRVAAKDDAEGAPSGGEPVGPAQLRV